MLFRDFPEIEYSVDGYKKNVANIMTSYLLQRLTTNRSFVFQNYKINAGDTPKGLSEKFYYSPDYYWVIYLVNNIVDPYTQWYYSFDYIENLCMEKYGDPADIPDNFMSLSKLERDTIKAIPLNKIHHYEYRGTTRYEDPEKGKIVENDVIRICDQLETEKYSKYDVKELPAYIIPITNYVHELNENEKRRNLTILKYSHLEEFHDNYLAILDDEQEYIIGVQSRLIGYNR